ncbi:protein of unknown function [Pararobbsia alpina]
MSPRPFLMRAQLSRVLRHPCTFRWAASSNYRLDLRVVEPSPSVIDARGSLVNLAVQFADGEVTT